MYDQAAKSQRLGHTQCPCASANTQDDRKKDIEFLARIGLIESMNNGLDSLKW